MKFNVTVFAENVYSHEMVEHTVTVEATDRATARNEGLEVFWTKFNMSVYSYLESYVEKA